jgi:preprotein translocase subunit SecD
MSRKAWAMMVSMLSIAGIGLCLLSSACANTSLAGGTRLKMKVAADEALAQELSDDAARISRELKSKGISFASSKKGIADIEIVDVDWSRDSEVQALIRQFFAQKYALHKTELNGKPSYVLDFLPAYARLVRESVLRQSMEIIRRRLEALGLGANVAIDNAGRREVSDCLIVEIPPVEDPDRVKALIENTAQLKLCFVKRENGGPYQNLEKAVQENGGSIPEDYQILLSQDKDAGQLQYLVVNKIPVITGKDIKTARQRADRNGNPAVSFFLTSDGARIFSDATAMHIGERLAIVLDNVIRSAPTINSRIESEGIIEGAFTVQQAEDLALLLRSGALPASVSIIEESPIQPR